MTAQLTDSPNHNLGGPIDHLGGMPFLDGGFVARRLLAMVAAARQLEAENAGKSIEAERTGRSAEKWLRPARVLLLRPDDGIPMPAAPLYQRNKRMIADALGSLAEAIPEWELLVALPVRYALLSPANGAISASSRSWPQHVLLAAEAFRSARALREQLVHELAHQWLYLIQEIWAFQTRGGQALTLPSGTGNRSAAEVLGAAHVAAALLYMYSVTGDASDGRIEHLARYGSGCLDLLPSVDPDMTDAGRQIARRVKEAF